DAPNTLSAASVMIQADQGSIELRGNVRADAGKAGGPVSVGLFAANDVDVRGAILLNGEEGATSRLDVGTTSGHIAFGAASNVAFAGDAKSELWVRTSRDNILSIADTNA